VTLRPFWNYYGGKWRAAPLYPAPSHGTIIEPFAGAAGYSMRYPDRKVILVEKYPVIAEIWRYLIGATSSEIAALPIADSVDDLPASMPQGAKWLIGFNLSSACATPRRTTSSGVKMLRASGRYRSAGWTVERRARCAAQVDRIRHWTVLECGYDEAPDIDATWFVDPPYQGRAGSHYRHGSKAIDYPALGAWCQALRGQVMVCEAVGASWLQFQAHASIKAGPNGTGRSAEALWTNSGSAGRQLSLRAVAEGGGV